MIFRKNVLLCFTVLGLLLLAGCFKGEQSLEDIDNPEDAEQVNSLNNTPDDEENNEGTKEDENDENDGKEEASTVTRDIYLLDVDGKVVPQTFELPVPDSKEVATQVLEYLVKDGPITNMLPNGFQAVLPEGTEVLSLNLQEDGLLVVDLSDDFTQYQAENEKKILEAMTFTLTQFDNIDQIQLQINGEDQTEMPVDGTSIGEGYSRNNGINIAKPNTSDLIASEAVTMHYPAEHNGDRYYVPVTQYVDSDDDLYSAIVTSLLDGPSYDMNVTHVFNAETLLTGSPTLKDGVLELEFNEAILADADETVISDDVMETLTRTLTEQHAVEAIQVEVENKDELENENGERYNKPVTTNMFDSTEKM